MRRLSLTARAVPAAAASDEVEVVLVRITHPDLAAPIRLSTDPTERLSLDPLAYGTRSTWPDAGGEPYLFVLASALLPDDQEDGPQQAQLVLEVVDADMATPLRATTSRATVDMAVVYAGSPDVAEVEFRGLQLVGVEGDAGELRLSLSRDPITSEPWPFRRMTRGAFPGLHR